MKCPYCKGALFIENVLHGKIACRLCLGTGTPFYDNDSGDVARPRELRRIAVLLQAREAMSQRRARAGSEMGAGIGEAIRVFDDVLAKEGA